MVKEIPSEQWQVLLNNPLGFPEITGYLFLGKQDNQLFDMNVIAIETKTGASFFLSTVLDI